eukprot:3441025-Amphidinium_carterae.1
MSHRIGNTIQSGITGTTVTLLKELSIHDMLNNNQCSRSGQTTCSNNQSMVHHFTACMAWVHQ